MAGPRASKDEYATARQFACHSPSLIPLSGWLNRFGLSLYGCIICCSHCRPRLWGGSQKGLNSTSYSCHMLFHFWASSNIAAPSSRKQEKLISLCLIQSSSTWKILQHAKCFTSDGWRETRNAANSPNTVCLDASVDGLGMQNGICYCTSESDSK